MVLIGLSCVMYCNVLRGHLKKNCVSLTLLLYRNLDTVCRRLAFLPLFYSINDEHHDGYSYVSYVNGGQPPPAPFFISLTQPLRSLTQLTEPLSKLTRPLAIPLSQQVGKMSQWLFSGSGSGHRILSALIGTMVHTLGKVVSSVVDRSR